MEPHLCGIVVEELPIDVEDVKIDKLYSTEKMGIASFAANAVLNQSTVGTKNGKVKTSIRVSEQDRVDIFVKSQQYHEKFSAYVAGIVSKLAPPHFRPAVEPGKYVPEYGCREIDNISWSAVRYKTGGYFDKHTDTVINELHFATVIILIPSYSKELEHTGGILRIWDGNGVLHEFDSSLIKKLTVVAFTPSLFHECTEVTSGTRLILKANWSYDKTMFELFKTTYDRNNYQNIGPVKNIANEILAEVVNDIKRSIDISVENNDYDDLYKNLKKNIEPVKGIKRMLSKNNSYNVKNILDALDREKSYDTKFAIIPLYSYYPNLGDLYTNDYLLLNAIREKWENAGVTQIKITTDLEDTDEPLNDNSDPPPYLSLDKLMKKGAKFIGEEYSEEYGVEIQQSTYNDDVYVNKTHVLITCIIVRLRNKFL